MMFFLSINITGDAIRFFFPERQHAVTFLPSQFEFRFDFLVHAMRRRPLHLADKLAELDRWRQTYQEVHMIGHAIMPERYTAASLGFVVQNLQKPRSITAKQMRIAGMRRPDEMVIQLVKRVTHDRVRPLKGSTDMEWENG